MMRRLVQRHKGILPLDTAESIWRVIIATFTHVQAPFSVHADLSAGDAMMRDSARFHFGFTVPFVAHVGAAGVVEAVSESKGDLGLVPAFATAHGGAWWTALEFDSAPKIIARLPFVDRADHPAALQVFVVSRAAADAMVTEVEIWSVRVAGWSARGRPRRVGARRDHRGAGPRLRRRGAAGLGAGRRRARPTITGALVKAGATVRSAALVGSHATRYTVPAAERSACNGTIVNDRHPSPAPHGRARDRRLCARQEQRAGRREGVQAVVERDAARAEPEGDRGLSARPASIWRIIRTARPRRCARRSAARSASIPTASSAAPAPTICSICWRAPISPTATRRSTPRTASWSIRSRRSAPAPSPWSRRRRTTPPTSMRSSSG